MYVFLQLFAIFVRLRPAGSDAARTLPRSFFAQAVVMYAVAGLTPILTFVVGGSNSPVTDAADVVWQTRNIAESAATVSIFTMIFAVALSVVKLVQAPAVTAQKSPAAEAAVKRDLLTAN